MARLTEEMVIARSKQSDLSAIKKLNCWGAELGDVSLLRRMPNVEVLALSINKIRTLDEFANCRRLRELYVRKNEIRELSEIRHLRRLPDLTSLWLDENPCTHHPQYRMTVLRNLPNLEKLDNVPVQPEEVQEAMRRGVHIPDSDDEGYPQQQETYGQYRRQRSCDSSPERDDHYTYRDRDRVPPTTTTTTTGGNRHDHYSEVSPTSASGGSRRAHSPEIDDRFEPAPTVEHYMTRGPRSPDDAPLRHSLSTHSVKDYSYSSNGECRYESRASTGTGGSGCGGGGVGGLPSPPHHQYHEPYCDRSDRSESYQQVGQRCPAEVWERERDRESVRAERDRDSAREYPSAVMAEHRGFTRRPVTRNSNLLSAVLCLVKELDYPSLEVAEMAVRCRMDELANSQ